MRCPASAQLALPACHITVPTGSPAAPRVGTRGAPHLVVPAHAVAAFSALCDVERHHCVRLPPVSKLANMPRARPLGRCRPRALTRGRASRPFPSGQAHRRSQTQHGLSAHSSQHTRLASCRHPEPRQATSITLQHEFHHVQPRQWQHGVHGNAHAHHQCIGKPDTGRGCMPVCTTTALRAG